MPSSRPGKTLDPGLRRGDGSTIGFFNPAHPCATQVLGDAGAEFLAKLGNREHAVLARRLRARGARALIVARGAALASPGAFARAGIAVTHDDRPAHEIVHALRQEQLEHEQARTTLHGVFLDVHDVGVLVTGPSGSGKSALALDLVARGHVLVADDAVDVRRPAPGLLTGHCPPLLLGYLETRGLGVLDVRAMHGAPAVRPHRRLDLVVRLVPGRGRALRPRERLEGRRGRRRILGESVPVVSLPAGLGHNLAPLVEAACLDQRLRLEGADAPGALMRRQLRATRRNR